MNFNINTEKAIAKWEPILEVIEYKGTKQREISEYCEAHSIIDRPVYNENYKSNGDNFLPLALKILTRINYLNMDNVLLKITNEVFDKQYVEVSLTKDEIEEYKQVYKIDLVTQVESQLVNLAIEKINKDISSLLNKETDIIFETGKLIDSMQVISTSEDNKTPTIRMYINYNLKEKE